MMLESGAKITPNILFNSGCPKQSYTLEYRAISDETKVRMPVGARGILNEDRLRRIECYTDEARKIS
jgi:hypothetical protein